MKGENSNLVVMKVYEWLYEMKKVIWDSKL